MEIVLPCENFLFCYDVQSKLYMLFLSSLLELCQAYTMELEAEVAKLKEENQKLRKKQVYYVILHMCKRTHTISNGCC